MKNTNPTPHFHIFTPLMVTLSIIISFIIPPVGIPILAIFVVAAVLRLIALYLNRKHHKNQKR